MRHHLSGIPELTEQPAVAVVIDVMRAFTVTAWAFARGAERIALAASDDEALALRRLHPEWLAVKDGAPAPGFDAVNSPAMMAERDLTGRTLVLRTTAGTVGARAVADTPLVLCASFAVADATARFLRAREVREATFVVTGDEGRAEEDRACAEYIARRVDDEGVDAAPYLARARASDAAADLTNGVRRGVHPDDVAFCLDADRFPFAMVAGREDGLLVLRPVPTAA
ncbi:2-phosphosulfolactate phosphatase [Streptomyces hainanensis]|uniref:Probable 2-phosphosulfolactate phosphatase n=1 Tax=Streptomyces hainanensis TaxID=402648 RepID=A0A4R4THJ0_9ACTN|nr:2-phosphosulfolactate phosphatase [Streptomyces hainanensis]TDC77067.1 2-phosphosulfolactate phosphatase [Streptomyces hainanensis]